MITYARRTGPGVSSAAVLAHSCGTCGARVAELRRGRCWGCYGKWAELRPVGRGASCLVCHERRRGNLRLFELHGRSLPFCHNCAAATARLPVVPFSVEGLRSALTRNRRRPEERRIGALDSRVFPRERRLDARRGLRSSEAPALLSAEALLEFQEEIPVDEADIIEVTTVSFAPQREPAVAPEAAGAGAAS